MSRLKPICACLFLFVIQLFGISSTCAEEEGQLWTSEVIKIPFLEIEGIGETTLRLENGNRWRDRYSEYFRAHYQGSLIIPIPEMEGWSWEPVYRKQVVEPGSGRQIDIDRYMLHLNKEAENIFGTGWDFGFRNRWEIIDIDDLSDQIMRTRFRGKLSKEIPGLKTCGEALRFWVSDEVFYNFEFDLWSRNRLATGIDIPLSERATVSVGFQWETFRFSHREHNWDDNHMILVEFKYNFPRSIFSD